MTDKNFTDKEALSAAIGLIQDLGIVVHAAQQYMLRRGAPENCKGDLILGAHEHIVAAMQRALDNVCDIANVPDGEALVAKRALEKGIDIVMDGLTGDNK